MNTIKFLLSLIGWRLFFIRSSKNQRTSPQLDLKAPIFLIALLAIGSTFIFHPAISAASSTFPKELDKLENKLPSLESQVLLPRLPPPKSQLEIPDEPSIDRWVRSFSKRHHKYFQILLNRARSYIAPAREALERKGLPEDLVYVALVESGFTPKARSKADAVGMWQFISSTGKRYGLEQNMWIDERCNPTKAARAATSYLSFLYDKFGSWPLALAGYNAGENAVKNALDRSGLKTFWDLSKNGYLPAETRDYVPKVLAAIKIARAPAQYGFYFSGQPCVPKDETVLVPGGVRLSWIGKRIGVPETLLKTCNPELCGSVTPPASLDYELTVPVGKGRSVLAALGERPLAEEKTGSGAGGTGSDSFLSYRIRRGDSLTRLAKEYHCSLKTLADLNGMSTSGRLIVGKELKVPSAVASSVDVAVKPPENPEFYASEQDLKAAGQR